MNLKVGDILQHKGNPGYYIILHIFDVDNQIQIEYYPRKFFDVGYTVTKRFLISEFNKVDTSLFDLERLLKIV